MIGLIRRVKQMAKEKENKENADRRKIKVKINSGRVEKSWRRDK